MSGDYKPAPTHHFAITESQPLAPDKNHFVTVGFSYRSDKKVDMEVRSWPIIEFGQELPPSPDQTFVATLW